MRNLVLAVALLATACGSHVAAGGSVPPSASPSTGTPANVLVTTAQNNGTVTAHVGDHIQIALGEQFRWQLDPPDGVVLVRPAVQNYLLVRGTQAIWTANAPGHSTIRATGTPVCASGSPCPMIATLFSVRVEVVP